MGTFRKKPVVIEAFRWTGGPDQIEDPVWICDAIRDGAVYFTTDGQIKMHIKTLEGTMTADVGDWIIKGVKGELYPCKPDIFAATYEEVLVDQDAARAAAGFDRPLEKYHSSNPKIGGE